MFLFLSYVLLFSTSAHRSVDGGYHSVVHLKWRAAVASKNERRSVTTYGRRILYQTLVVKLLTSAGRGFFAVYMPSSLSTRGRIVVPRANRYFTPGSSGDNNASFTLHHGTVTSILTSCGVFLRAVTSRYAVYGKNPLL